MNRREMERRIWGHLGSMLDAAPSDVLEEGCVVDGDGNPMGADWEDRVSKATVERWYAALDRVKSQCWAKA